MQRVPIIQQQRMPKLGDIRIGWRDKNNPRKSRKGDTFYPPAYLDNFRLTTSRKELLEAAVDLGWGEEILPWDSPNGKQWELFTTLPELAVLVPPWQSISSYHEIWGNNLLERRCDGEMIIGGKQPGLDAPCMCQGKPDNEWCPIYTRLQIALPDLPGLGIWQLSTKGKNAKVELSGCMEILTRLSVSNAMVNCTLSMEWRSSRDTNTGEWRKYKVPMIQPKGVTMRHLLTGEVPAEALAIPRRAEPKQIAQAYGDLGYGDEIPPVYHHPLPQATAREEEPNPFAPKGEFSHIIVEDITNMYNRIVKAANRRREAVTLLQSVFGPHIDAPEKIAAAVAELEPKSANPKFFAFCGAKMLSEEKLPGAGIEAVDKWRQAFDTWMSDAEVRFMDMQAGKVKQAEQVELEV